MIATDTTLTPETIEKAANAAAKAFGVTPAAIRGTRRQATIAEARFAFLFLLHEDAGESSPRVGKALDRDHTTILWGVHRAKELASAYRKYAARLMCAREAFALATNNDAPLTPIPKPKPAVGRMPWL